MSMLCICENTMGVSVSHDVTADNVLKKFALDGSQRNQMVVHWSVFLSLPKDQYHTPWQ